MVVSHIVTVWRRAPWARTVTLVVLVLAGFIACSSDPATVKARYLERGTKYLADNKYNEAIIEFRNALQVDANYTPALHALGRAYRGKSWSMDALRVFQRLVEEVGLRKAALLNHIRDQFADGHRPLHSD